MSISLSNKKTKQSVASATPSEDGTGGDRPAPRDRIVSSACTLFRQHGIRGIGVDAIAEAAETNKMTLYRHFGSKDDLVCETLKVASNKAAELWSDLEASCPGDPAGQMEGWVEARTRCLMEEPLGCDLANAAVELRESGHPAHALIEDFKLAQQARLVELCRVAGANNPDVLADTLSMLLEGARVSRLATGRESLAVRFGQACRAAITSIGGIQRPSVLS